MDPEGKVTEDIYRVRGFPTTFFVDKDGVIRYQHIGQMDEGQLVKYLEGIGVGQ
jgi:thioredoxin-related protein